MDRFDSMRLFVRIVELGSFTRAAEDRHLPRATVTHAMQQLEKRLGVRLLQRTTRHVAPTPEGRAYYDRCTALLAAVEAAESDLGRTAERPTGRVRVDLQSTFAREVILPALPAFLARYPEVELEVSTNDRLVDLVREGIDCVLRSGEPRDSSLVARRVAMLPQATVASPGYLAQHGVPKSLEALKAHWAVNYFSPSTGRIWPLDFVVKGERRWVTMKSRVSVSAADAYVACCEAGLGIIQVPRYHLEAKLSAGRLVEVLPKWKPAPMPVSVMLPQRTQVALRVRVFVDWVSELMHARFPGSERR